MKASDLGLLVALGSIWGMSYVFIRVAAPVLGPIPLMAFRFGVSASVLCGYLLLRGRGTTLRTGLRTEWKSFVILGLLLMALPTTLIGYAELEISASLASVLNASVPFFTAGAAFFWLGESLSVRQVGGLLLGFIGVAIAVGGVAVNVGGAVVPFAAASVLAAAMYGVASVYLRKARLRTTGVASSASTQVMAAVLLLPLVPLTAHSGSPPTAVWASALGLALLSTTVAYIIYFHLVDTVGPTQASTVTFISPVAGILGGALLLGEPLTGGLLIGLTLIFLGIFLSSRDVGAFLRAKRSASP